MTIEDYRAGWRTAITLANNLCVAISDRSRDDDGPPEYIGAAADCAKSIRNWADPSDEQLLQLLQEAGVIDVDMMRELGLLAPAQEEACLLEEGQRDVPG